MMRRYSFSLASAPAARRGRYKAGYGRTAQALIDDGWIKEEGEVLVRFVD